MNKNILKYTFFLILLTTLFIGCGAIAEKKYYIINYEPDLLTKRLNSAPYPVTIRIKEFAIEQAYSKQNIVYRKSPFELQYYFYRMWAVKPTRMITDIIVKHIKSAHFVSRIIQRLDEGKPPDYELSGTIEAIEEYDSEDVWFAHLSIRIKMARLHDNRIVYNRHFDRRKLVSVHNPEMVVRGLSEITDYIVSQMIHDIDVVLAKELGTIPPAIQGE